MYECSKHRMRLDATSLFSELFVKLGLFASATFLAVAIHEREGTMK